MEKLFIAYTKLMDGGVVINISWEYYIGIFVALVGFAWYSNGRFTRLETSMEWLKDMLKDLKITTENQALGAFAHNSPVSLTEVGQKVLQESGLKNWIDEHKDTLLSACDGKKTTNPYEVQEHVFDYFDTLKFDDAFADELKKVAFAKGYSMSILRRVGAIYFRDICIESFKW